MLLLKKHFFADNNINNKAQYETYWALLFANFEQA
jgi:hypothetical protein